MKRRLKGISKEPEGGMKQQLLTRYLSVYRDVLYKRFGLTTVDKKRSSFNDILSTITGVPCDELELAKNSFYRQSAQMGFDFDQDEWQLDNGEIQQTLRGIELPARVKWDGMDFHVWRCYYAGFALEVYTEHGEKVSDPDVYLPKTLKLARHEDGSFSVLHEDATKAQTPWDANPEFQNVNGSRQEPPKKKEETWVYVPYHYNGQPERTESLVKEPDKVMKQPLMTQYVTEFKGVKKFGLVLVNNKRSSFNEILSTMIGESCADLERDKDVFYRDSAERGFNFNDDPWLLDDGSIRQIFNGIELPARVKWDGMDFHVWKCYYAGFALEVYTEHGEKVSDPDVNLPKTLKLGRYEDGSFSVLRENTINAQTNQDANVLFQHGTGSIQKCSGKGASQKGRQSTINHKGKVASKGKPKAKVELEKKVKEKCTYVRWDRDSTKMFQEKYEVHRHAEDFKIREFAKIFLPLGFTFRQVDKQWKRMYPDDAKTNGRWSESADAILKELRIKFQHPMYKTKSAFINRKSISKEGWELLANEFNKRSNCQPKPTEKIRRRCVRINRIEAKKLKLKLKLDKQPKKEKVGDKWDNNAVPICAFEMEYKGSTILVQAAYTATGESGRVLTVPYNEAEHGIKITECSHKCVYDFYKQVFSKIRYLEDGYLNVQFNGYVPLENMNRSDLLGSVERRIKSQRSYRYDRKLDEIVQPDGTIILGTKMYKNRMYCISEKDNRQSATRIVGEYEDGKHGRIIDSTDIRLYSQLRRRIQTYGEYKNVPFILLAELAEDYGHVHVWISEMKQHFDRNEKYSHLSKKEKDARWLMERGCLLEPVLLQLYRREQNNGNMELDTRQVTHSIVNPRGGGMLRCRPDGTVGDIGCVEGKSPASYILHNANLSLANRSKLVRFATPEEIRLGCHGKFLCNSWEDTNVYHLQEGTEVEKQIARHLFIGNFEWCDLVYYYQDDMNSKDMIQLWVQRLYKKDLKKCWDKNYRKR